MAKYVVPISETAVSPVVHPASCDNWLPQAARQLKAIADLPDGWDSHRSARPDLQIVERAEQVLGALRAVEKSLAKPRIHPTPSGGVQFQWESERRYLEIELVEVDRAQFYFVNRIDELEDSGEFRVGAPPPATLIDLIQATGKCGGHDPCQLAVC